MRRRFGTIVAVAVLALAACGRLLGERFDEHGMTALMYAARDGRLETAARLIRAGADVNARDDHGKSVLQYAACHSEAGREIRAAGARQWPA